MCVCVFLVSFLLFLKVAMGWDYTSVVQYLLSMYKDLNSMPRTGNSRP